ncbi:hypothetical protein JW698_00710 [Candidatus Wolfebacteria bacterium]|nr:hypothetical protein [Candidatus Wolfebacteria bacterium]
MINYFSLGILVLIFGTSFFLRGRPFRFKFYRFVFWSSFILIFCWSFFQTFILYNQWEKNAIAKFLIPPYENINYFIFYSGIEFFAPFIISLFFALLFFFFAKKLNKKNNECFFEPEEPYLGAMALFLTSHPGWLFYFIVILFVYLFIHIYSLFFIHKSSFRIPLYYLWIPVGIFVIIIQRFLELLPLWNLLKI